tara:strand:+ start:521 stop:1897 length:1377 start_codon:yes stop_codon:yes gene_type:complete
MTKGLLEHPLRGSYDPATVFATLCGQSPYAIWWDDHGDRGHGVSYIAEGSPLELSLNSEISPQWRSQVRAAHRELLEQFSGPATSYPLGVHLVVPYELASETLGVTLSGDPSAPGCAMVVDRLIACDHRSGTATLVALGQSWSGELALWRDELTQRLEAPSSSPAPPVGDKPAVVLDPPLTLTWRDSAQEYLGMIDHAHDAIARGDAYQVCLTTRVSSSDQIDPVALHQVMRSTNPTHHQALLRLGETTIVSASPETFLDLSASRTLTTRPIKGTRPRGATPSADHALAEELLTSDKERAENLMIVDLMRNDLSRVCEVGSISVPELLVLESYTRVHQLVSTVTGTLREGLDPLDVLDATFPAGSMTGAPKKRAVELLASWEKSPRGYYSGTYGVWRVDGSAVFAMTIRALVANREGFSLGVGGGITALSEPQSEITEVGIKASAFLEALGHDQVEYS